jgi:peptide/nickel transport system substrate-binding protein
MHILRALALAMSAMLLSIAALAQGTISNLPREETIIIENPEGTVKNPGWFNYWAVNAGGRSTGLQQLALDTFWYIDPDYGIDGVWDNSLAAEKPIYNDDFTEMTVKLRPGIYWSDGVESPPTTSSTPSTPISTPTASTGAPRCRSTSNRSRRPIPTPWCSSSRSRTHGFMRCSRCAGTRCG